MISQLEMHCTKILNLTSGQSFIQASTISVFCTWRSFIRSIHRNGDPSFVISEVASSTQRSDSIGPSGNLLEAKLITNETITRPSEAMAEDLLVVHTARYLSSLRWSLQVARVLEVPPIALLPNFLVQRRVLKPLRYQTGGTILVRHQLSGR